MKLDPSVDSSLRPRVPQQDRGRARVERVLAEAEKVVGEEGVDGFSIPMLAERLGYPRPTIYKFFPTPYAVLNQLAERHLEALESHLLEQAKAWGPGGDWQDVTRNMVGAAAGYYRTQPAACNLLLAGPHTHSSYRALELSIARLGRLTRTMFSRVGLHLSEGPPDLAALAVEYGTASFRLSYFLEGRITDAYVDAAGDVMVAFLSTRLTRDSD